MDDLTGLLIQLGIPLTLLIVTYFTGRIVIGRHRARLEAGELEMRGVLVSDLRDFAPRADPSKPPALVVAEVVLSVDYFRSWLAKFFNIVGGEIPGLTSAASRALGAKPSFASSVRRSPRATTRCAISASTPVTSAAPTRRSSAREPSSSPPSPPRPPTPARAHETPQGKPVRLRRATPPARSPRRSPDRTRPPRRRARHAPSLPTLEHAAVNSVWDEPDAPPAPARLPPAPVAPHEKCSACGYSLVGLTTEAACPECGLPIDLRFASYATWLRHRAATVTPRESWLVTAALALVAGPLAIVTAFWGSNETGDPFALLSPAIGAAPTIEEIAKAGAALMIIETRPWLFRSRAQITIACVASAAAFAAVENVLYLNVYIPHPDPSLVAWRWTVCVALHVGCSAIASLGLRRMHREVFSLGARPRIEAALPFVCIAILVHAVYNALVIVLSLTHVI